MTETMIERVARSLCARHYRDRYGKPSSDPHVQMNVDGNWHLFSEDARAAIEAMREPTDIMQSAGCQAIYHSDRDWRANAAYRAMLDAALGESDA